MSDDREPLDLCPISRALAVVGNRSVLLILREAYYGTTRFDDFATRIGIAESMAAARLRDLVAEGLLERRPYQEPGQRTRYEYVLTEAGADLLPVVLGLGRWGEKHRPSSVPTRMLYTHTGCGETVSAEARCAAGHRVTLDDLTVDAPSRRATSLPV
jgi:DNA-binding HxlR family transcriptional regulator